MAVTSGVTASALVGALLIVGSAADVRAQRTAGSPALLPVGLVGPADGVALDPNQAEAPDGPGGGIDGTVRNEQGEPLAGVVVSVVGATTAFAVTDEDGRFAVGTLSPGPYLVRAHCSGYLPPKPRTIAVRPRVRTASSFAMRRADSAPTILAAGIGGSAPEPQAIELPVPADSDSSIDAPNDDHSETAWRMRHVRRGILRNASLPDNLLLSDDDGGGSVAVMLGRAVSSPARVATSFFAETPFSGQVNILTTNSFDTPEQLLTGDSMLRGIAYVKVGAPLGGNADWTVRGAFTEADVSSWIVAGDYRTRGPARHRYDLGLSYSTQRYDGGNPLALRQTTDGSRNAGTVYGFDTFTLTPAIAVTYGARYARYDYLDRRGLISPKAEISLKATKRTRLSLGLSSRADAPGAEEFMPPSDEGIWLPPQRTFSSAAPGRPLTAQRTTQLEAELERDFGVATIGVRAFRQRVDDQMVTVFGAEVPEFPGSKLGHYVVGNAGDMGATGATVALRSSLGRRVHGSVAYSTAVATMISAPDASYIIVLSPSSIRGQAERLQNVSTTLEADLPETATRVLVLYRIGNAYARPFSTGDAASDNLPRVDSRFDIQVRQSLPFLNFTSARWEMLVAIRNFFREAESDQSVYDELLTIRAPKRIVGGVTLHF